MFGHRSFCFRQRSHDERLDVANETSGIETEKKQKKTTEDKKKVGGGVTVKMPNG